MILWDIACNCIRDTGAPMKVISVILILYCIFCTGAAAWAGAKPKPAVTDGFGLA